MESKFFQVPLTLEEIELYHRAAKLAHMSLASWMEARLRTAAIHELRVGRLAASWFDDFMHGGKNIP